MATTFFTEDHERVRTELRAYVEAKIAPFAEEWEEARDFPSDAIRDLGRAGFLGLSYPREYGGYGGDYLHTMVFAEELQRCGSGSFYMAVSVQTDMATPPIYKFGTEAQRQQWLVPAIQGEKIGCIGITEPDAGSNVVAITTHAPKDGSEWVINGSKLFITNGARADFCTLVAKTDRFAKHDGVSLFIVPLDSPGVTVARKLDKVGMWASDTAELVFDNVRLPEDALLGEEGKGFYHLMWELQGERLIAAAGAAAGAQMGLTALVDMAKERTLFGRPLAEHDWVRYRIAEMAVKIKGVRELVYLAAELVNRGEYPVREISMAKLASMTISCDLADLGLEIAGEEGIWSGLPMLRLWRDSRLGRIGGGTDEMMRDVVGKMLGL
jgi:alkylation response protein AidB-like acyl-CoA dehydrogenase